MFINYKKEYKKINTNNKLIVFVDNIFFIHFFVYLVI